MDKIKESEKDARYKKKIEIIEHSASEKDVTVRQFFGTSIWDETLYQAWSQIVQLLIPNMTFIKQTLKEFCEVSGCDEAVLFERSTFLIIGYHDVKNKPDLLKYEKVSNIIKQFKLTCKYHIALYSKIGANIDNLVVNTPTFTSLIEEYTPTCNMMVIFSDPEVSNPPYLLRDHNHLNQHQQ